MNPKRGLFIDFIKPGKVFFANKISENRKDKWVNDSFVRISKIGLSLKYIDTNWYFGNEDSVTVHLQTILGEISVSFKKWFHGKEHEDKIILYFSSSLPGFMILKMKDGV